MLDKPLKDKYAMRWVTSTNPENEFYIMGYEVVDLVKAILHASDQVIYTTKDENEAKRYVAMLNKQDQLERS
jgi:predicted transcriptional regulator